MAVLAGALDALRSTLPPAEQTSQAMRMADDAASQLQRLHDRIVLLSRLRSGDTILQPAPTDLSQLARQCTDARQSLATSARVTLRYMGPETTWAWFDAEQASSMIGELIDNALRYTPEGGEVIIETAEHSGVIGVEVLDTGPGIPPEALATIMDEFVVGDIRHHRRGTGLGLAIVRELVTALRGTVTVENREGGGARVALRFPKAAPPAGSVDESPRDVDAQAA
jgi:two-component system sensor histidine kinase ResE